MVYFVVNVHNVEQKYILKFCTLEFGLTIHSNIWSVMLYCDSNVACIVHLCSCEQNNNNIIISSLLIITHETFCGIF